MTKLPLDLVWVKDFDVEVNFLLIVSSVSRKQQNFNLSPYSLFSNS